MAFIIIIILGKEKMILLNYKPITSQLWHDSQRVKNHHHYNHQQQMFDQSTVQTPIKHIIL